MKNLVLIFSLILATSSHATRIEEPPLQPSRCGEDSLDNNQAVGRNKWVMKCIPEARHSWLLNENGFVNFYLGETLIETGYFRLDKTNPDGSVSVVHAPTNESVGCEQAVREQWYIVGACRASCLTPDQWVELKDERLVQIGRIAKSSSTKKDDSEKEKINSPEEVFVLDENSTLDNVIPTTVPIKAVITDKKEVEQDILKIETVSGGEIKVTLNHPLLNEKGFMKKAEDLRVGDYLVQRNGQPDQIVAIQKSSYFGRVYNIEVDTSAAKTDEDGIYAQKIKANNIMNAQGFLSGTVFYQDIGLELVDRQIAVLNIPAELIR